MDRTLQLFRPIKKRWLKPLQKYRINIEYVTGVEATPRTLEVSDAFGLGVDQKRKFTIYDDFIVDIGPKDVVYITGDSGSGKSVLLHWLEEALEDTINISDVRPDPDQPLIEQIGETFTEGLRLLSKAGLNDAFLFVRRYRELSDGQKYRFKIAKMMESERQYWVFDEFCSVLDRDTAKIVAYNVQKLARREKRAVLAATTHTDLFRDFSPSVYIHKRYGKEVELDYQENQLASQCSLIDEIELVEGSYDDWKKLAGFHYRSHHLAFPRKIFSLRRGDELCGVICYCYPASTCFGRAKVFQPSSMEELNDKLSVIRRIVVHPKYRTIGLGHKLIEETLDKAGTRYVELIAVMAQYNPFAEKAGMQKIAEKEGSKEAFRIADVLRDLGFQMQLLGSNRHVKEKLEGLSDVELERVREAFLENRHPKFQKAWQAGTPYGTAKAYRKLISEAAQDDLARLIVYVSELLQTKVYLFYDTEDNG